MESRKYEVELLDGVVYDYYHNILSENLLSQLDEEERELILTKEISDHKIDKSAIREWIKGNITTKIWKLLFKWKYGAQYWIPMKDIKESNPADIAEYYNANNLLEVPAFKWWANKVLKIRTE